MPKLTPWSLTEPIHSPFALPTGPSVTRWAMSSSSAPPAGLDRRRPDRPATRDRRAFRLRRRAVRSCGLGQQSRPGAPVGDVEEGALRQRPEPQVWSALEYACHVRDVFLVQRERLFLALVEDCPSFAPMYRDQRVTLARYAAEDPTRVADQLHMAATLVGETFGGIDDAGWRRENASTTSLLRQGGVSPGWGPTTRPPVSYGIRRAARGQRPQVLSMVADQPATKEVESRFLISPLER